ncbi:hypothetical protein [Spiroplasma sp. DGKH1]|uniref:hypothetical protein n=1 Tax=Spiroplasma sp. DGKH1 TaxID=3050074 RepID=UPI0034C653E5
MYIDELTKLIEPLINKEDSILFYEIRQLPSLEQDIVNLLVMCHHEIFGHVVGKNGQVANSLRKLINLRSAVDHKKVNLTFELL